MSEAMNQHHDQPSDASVGEANMRSIAAAIELGAEPTAQQRARWRSAPATRKGLARLTGGRLSLRSRLWAAGSAIAATAAIGALFIHSLGGGSPVQASTILTSLRQAVISGVNVSVRGVAAEGFTIDGDMHLRFDQPVSMEAIFEHDDDAFPEIPTMYASLDVRANGFSMLEGLDTHVELASSAESTWAFIQANPKAGIAPARLARHVMGVTMFGVMIDFGPGGLKALDLFNDARQDAGAGAAGEDDEPRYTISVGMKAHVHNGLSFDVHRGEKADGHEGLHAQAGGGAGEDSDAVRHDALLRQILTGRAGDAEINEMLEILQRHAADAEVEPQGNGRYLLKVLMDPSDPAANAGSPAGSMVQVSYAQDRGVEWAEFVGVGELTGAVRVDFTDGPIDPALFNKDRLIVPGRTTVVSPQMLRSLIGLGEP